LQRQEDRCLHGGDRHRPGPDLLRIQESLRRRVVYPPDQGCAVQPGPDPQHLIRAAARSAMARTVAWGWAFGMSGMTEAPVVPAHRRRRRRGTADLGGGVVLKVPADPAQVGRVLAEPGG